MRRVTGWFVAGAVALTGLLAAVTAWATPGARAGSSTGTPAGSSAVPNPRSSDDQGLQPMPGDSRQGQRGPANTSSGGS